MKDLIEFIAKSLADDPEAVQVTETGRPGEVHIKLNAAEDDMGRLIGRSGRVVNAMRILLRVAAARRNARATLDIV